MVLGEDHGGEGALCYAQVVVARGSIGLVGGYEALGHQEGDFVGGCGDWDVLDVESREELGVEQVAALGEDRGCLVHTVITQ